MGTDFSEALDYCIDRINDGETVETCLADYPQWRKQLEPMLRTASSVSAIPTILPSDNLRTTSKARVMLRIQEEKRLAKAAKAQQKASPFGDITTTWNRLLGVFTGAKRVAIPVTIAILLALVASSFLPTMLPSPSPYQVLASECTVSLLSGSVEVQGSGADSWQAGQDGMTLSVGDRIKTAAGSHAILTFFEGSTTKLDAGTDVEIKRLEFAEGQPTVIVMKQWLGRTWSRVVKMTDSGSQYEIETPSAVAMVRGTLFATDVNETGATQVATTEGLVSVVAQGEEVFLPATQQTEVDSGNAPSQPATVPGSENELIITIDAPAMGSIQDPTGSSTGQLSNGFTFNQISGSQSYSSAEGTQVITIPNPVSGEYTIALRYTTKGTANFHIQGNSTGAVYQYSGGHKANAGSEWLININLQVEDGQLSYTSVSDVKPLGGKAPEKLVIPA
ncbi:FecR domain-containing protein, partial [Bacteroidota bacterium]